MRPLFFSTLIMLLPLLAAPAVVYGNVYEWSTLERLSKAIVSVNTSPKQVRVAENGSYSFQLPSGSYEIIAEYRLGNETIYRATENITVSGEGGYALDLLLFPTEEFFPETLVEIPELNISPGALQEPAPGIEWYWLAVGIIIVALVIPAGIWVFLRRKKPVPEPIGFKYPHEPLQAPLQVSVKKVEELPKPELTPEQKEVLEKIREVGGSMGQKDLRRALRVSEAKASMLVSELEEKSFVRKIKKGRGNLIKLLKF